MKPLKNVKHLRVDQPKKFRLGDVDPADCGGFDVEKDEAKALLAEGAKRLAELQERLYAQDRWAVLAARTAPSSTSCRASIRRACRSSPSRRRARRNSTTTSCGGRRSTSRSAAASASSTD